MATEWTSGKIYDRCAYLNCYNGKYSTGHKLFRFPAYSDSRHHLWIRYAGNVRLRTWASATIRRAGICADHFDPECFTDETHQTLRRHAVPKPYSATDAQAKPSSTLLAQIKSLPRKQTTTRKMSDSEDVEIEFEAHSSQKSSDTTEPKNTAEKAMLIQTKIPKAVKTLRKIKRIKIEERISNTNRTMILEKCKNPETCPVAKQKNSHENGKPRLHFHKVYVENPKETKSTLKTYSKAAKRKSVDNYSVSSQKIIESFEEGENKTNGQLCNVEIRKGDEKACFQLEKIHIDLAKASPKKEEASSTSRYTGEPENLMSNWQAIQEARAASELEKARKISHRKPTNNVFIEEYYKSKEGCSFDRCVYVNCKNGRFTTGAHLFRFPQINDPRLVTWMKNAGNPKMLYWTWSTIRRAGLCADHFTKDSFFNETRQRLLRTAVPKPFYLEKNAPSGNNQAESMSQEDLLKIFTIIENERKNGSQDSAEPAPIDLPSEMSPNRENLVIKYPFEDSEVVESDNESEMRNFENVSESEERLESFANVMVKTEITDEETDDIFSTTSGLTHLIEEPEEDPLDDLTNDLEEESDDVDDIENILAIQQQKARLCKVINQFSMKLKNARIRKHKLHSRLRAHDMKMQSFG